jgi:hypothetical protein
MKINKRILAFLLRLFGWIFLIAAVPFQEFDLFASPLSLITLLPGIGLLLLAEKIYPKLWGNMSIEERKKRIEKWTRPLH